MRARVVWAALGLGLMGCVDVPDNLTVEFETFETFDPEDMDAPPNRDPDGERSWVEVATGWDGQIFAAWDLTRESLIELRVRPDELELGDGPQVLSLPHPHVIPNLYLFSGARIDRTIARVLDPSVDDDLRDPDWGGFPDGGAVTVSLDGDGTYRFRLGSARWKAGGNEVTVPDAELGPFTPWFEDSSADE